MTICSLFIEGQRLACRHKPKFEEKTKWIGLWMCDFLKLAKRPNCFDRFCVVSNK
jgi:hypothetical protein